MQILTRKAQASHELTLPDLERVEQASRQVLRAAGREYVQNCVDYSLIHQPRKVRRELARQYERSQWKKRRKQNAHLDS